MPSSAVNGKRQRKATDWERLRDLFKRIGDTKGKFHANMGSIKDRKGMTKQKQKILRRGGKNTTMV